MSDAPIVDNSRIEEEFEMRPVRPRPLSRYDSTYSMLENYDIEKALKIIDAEDWQNAEPFLNPWGSQQVALVHFAACRGNLRMLERAAHLHAPMYATDEFGRCALHYAAAQGHAEVVKWLLEHSDGDGRPSGRETSAHPQLSLPDHHGRTALHQAVKAKHVAVVKLLVNAGANVNARDEQGVPPLLMAHFNVVRDDFEMVLRYEKIVDILASGWASVSVVHPLTGWSALHYAVTLNSRKATDRLIKCGANPVCCRRGRLATTPIHLAARFGYHQTLRILLKDLQTSWVDTPNEYGFSPLHLAAMLGNLECVRALVDKGGNLAKETPHGNTVIDLLSMFKQDTDLAVLFTDMLDAKIRLVDMVTRPAQIVYEIVLNFEILAPQNESQMGVVSALMKALPRMKQITILQHPLLEIYLWQKWSRVRYIFYSFVIIHVVFILLLSCYAIFLLRNDLESTILRRMLLLSGCIPFCQILLQFLTEPKRYCTQIENWLSLISVTISIVVAVAGEFIPNAMTTAIPENRDDQLRGWQPSWILHSTSIAILLGWMQIMLLAGRFPAWGFYALIFSTVLKNVLKVFFIGVWIIVSFSLSFSLLFYGNDQFNNPFNAFVKTVVMMTGEYDYGDLFPTSGNDSMPNGADPNKNQSTLLPVMSRVVFLIFVLLASIVLMNLMIGLAVSDIQGLVKEGRFSRLLKQADFIANCERITTGGIFRSGIVPNWLTNILKSTIDTKRHLSWHWGQKRHRHLSEKLWKDLLKTCLKNRDHDKRYQPNSTRSRNIDSIMSGLQIRERCETLDDELENVYNYIT